MPMRVESSVLSVSWIPSEAVTGMTKLPFEVGMTHYDDPPPERLSGPEELEALRKARRFRFANDLRGWVDVEDGAIVGHGQSGGGHLGITRVSLGRAMGFQAIALPDLHPEPEVGPDWVRFVQTVGGRPPIPAPRRVAHKPFVQLRGPTVWTTLSLTIHADGSVEHELTGASAFPRHWVYDGSGRLSHKSGLMDFKEWYHHAFGMHSPWGDEDSPAVVSAVETALERELSATLMRGGARPNVQKVREGVTLVEQGEPGGELFLLLDGVLSVEVDGEALAEVGPGAVLGERAVLEGGRRTATLRAVTPCRVAVATGDAIDLTALSELSEGHRREEAPPP
jgi:Cyclic nucleotide-binding domain